MANKRCLVDEPKCEICIKLSKLINTENNQFVLTNDSIKYNKSNVTIDSYKFKYSKDNSLTWNTVTIPSGFYNHIELNKKIEDALTANGDWVNNVIRIDLTTDYPQKFYILILGSYLIDFTIDNSLRNVLGFDSKIIANGINIADRIGYSENDFSLTIDELKNIYYDYYKYNRSECYRCFYISKLLNSKDSRFELRKNSISINHPANINDENNQIRYSEDNGETWDTIIIPNGYYEMWEINSKIEKCLKSTTKIRIDVDKTKSKSIVVINKPYLLDFTADNSLRNVLGFDSKILGSGINIADKTFSNGYLCKWFFSIYSELSGYIKDLNGHYKVLKKPRY